MEEGQEPVLRVPSTRTPSPGEDACRVYLQERGHWEVCPWWGKPGDTVSGSERDWSGTLESTIRTTTSTVRVGTTP